MLCAVLESDNDRVTAFSALKDQAPFLCPECKEKVILRKGIKRIHHFAHKPPVTCQYGTGETEAHRLCKISIYEHLVKKPNVRNPALERYMKTVRPDVSARISDVPVAIEVQISNLPIDTVVHRTQEYTRRGIYILWLAQWDPSLDSGQYSPSLWERWLHAAYLGRIYYWKEGLSVIPYHMAPFLSYVEEREWRSESSGGYWRTSKRFKTPIRGRTIEITSDFLMAEKDEWRGGSIYVPRRKIFLDKFGKPMPSDK
jgi:competence protein CoiA